MDRLPPVSNVFGYLYSSRGLSPVALVLRTRLGLSPEEVWVTRSAFDGGETLRVETAVCSLETAPARGADRWQFNGAVAGTPDEIFETLRPLVENLRWAQFAAEFEIYDAAFRFVRACPDATS